MDFRERQAVTATAIATGFSLTLDGVGIWEIPCCPFYLFNVFPIYFFAFYLSLAPGY
jgi:hypothetical protein